MNDCSKKNYIILNNNYNKIFEINIISEDSYLYYSNSINEINDLFNQSNYILYEYPFMLNSKNIYFELICKETFDFNLSYYHYNENNINVSYNYTYYFYIQENSQLEINITNSYNSKKNFGLLMELIPNKYYNQSININFNDNSIISLNNNKNIQLKKYEEFLEDSLIFESKNNCLIKIDTSISNNDIEYIYDYGSYSFSGIYHIFISKVDINSNSNIIENVFIFNKFNTKEVEVFFRKEYDYTDIIFHLKNEYINLKNQENISISLSPISSLKNYNKEEEKKQFILIYNKGYTNFEYVNYNYTTLLPYEKNSLKIKVNYNINYKIFSFNNKIINNEIKGNIVFNFSKKKIKLIFIVIKIQKIFI